MSDDLETRFSIRCWQTILKGTTDGTLAFAQKFLQFCKDHNLTDQDLYDLNLVVKEVIEESKGEKKNALIL